MEILKRTSRCVADIEQPSRTENKKLENLSFALFIRGPKFRRRFQRADETPTALSSLARPPRSPNSWMNHSNSELPDGSEQNLITFYASTFNDFLPIIFVFFFFSVFSEAGVT